MQRKIIKTCLIAALFLLIGNVWALRAEVVTPQNSKPATLPSTEVDAETMERIKFVESDIQQLETEINGTKGKNGTRGLNGELNDLEAERNNLVGEIGAQLKKLGFDKAWIEKNAAKLNDEYNSLSSKAAAQKTELGALSKETKRLTDETEKLNADIKELEAIRDSVVKVTISSKEQLFTKPFSELKSLNDDIKECEKYSDAKEIRNFLTRLYTLRKDKAVYDKGVKMLTSKFDSVKIRQAKLEIEQCKTRANEKQKAEFDKLLKDFDTFEEGVNAFYEFIMILNARRGQSSYFTTPDFEHFFNGMKERRPEWKDRYDRCIMTNSYLQKGFNKFVEQVRKSPQSHPEIEKEILSSATKNKQN